MIIPFPFFWVESRKIPWFQTTNQSINHEYPIINH